MGRLTREQVSEFVVNAPDDVYLADKVSVRLIFPFYINYVVKFFKILSVNCPDVVFWIFRLRS